MKFSFPFCCNEFFIYYRFIKGFMTRNEPANEENAWVCFWNFVTKLGHVIPYHTIPYRTVSYRTVPYRTVPYRTVPYRTVPYHTIPHYYISFYSLYVVPENGILVNWVETYLKTSWINHGWLHHRL